MSQTKTHLALPGLLATLLILAACGDVGGSNNGDENIVNVYNWADYIAPDTIEKFEAEYGITVNYDMYDSSEIVDVKMLAGRSGYDVVFHSNEFAVRLAPIGVYEKLDFSRLDNIRHLDPDIMKIIDAFEEVRGYNVPYHWGNTGYAWNVELVRRTVSQRTDSRRNTAEPADRRNIGNAGNNFRHIGWIGPGALWSLPRQNVVFRDDLVASRHARGHHRLVAVAVICHPAIFDRLARSARIRHDNHCAHDFFDGLHCSRHSVAAQRHGSVA